MRLTKRLTAFLLTLALAFSLCPAASAAIVEPFEDVPADAYYAPAVEWALAAGVTDGIAPTRFGPDYTVTRGQAVTFLWRAMGQPEPEDTQCPFNDVNAGDYFYDPVLWAVENGITDGTSDTTFSPADTLTRAHIITFIWRTAGWPNDNGSELWYTDAVNWAQKEDLLSGTARAFAPGDPCPRADVVTYLYRANEAGFLYWDGDCRYEFVLDDCSWTEAFENALDAGGHLVRIETPEEYEIILSEIAKRGMENVQFRIGARRDSSSEEYRWVDDNNQLIGDVLNSPGSWIAPLWEAGEPSFRWAGNEETVLEIEFIPDFQDWQWNDIQDWVPTASGGNNLGYIIEYDYEDYEDLFDVPVEEMNDAQMLDAMDEWIDLDEDGLKDEDGYIALADWPELMEYMVDSAECLKEEGLLTAYSYSEEDAYILYTLRSGLWVLYKPPIRENQGLAGAPVSTIEPNRNEDKYSVKGKDFADHAGEATQLQKTITDLGIGYTAGSQLVNDDATLSEIIQCLDNSADGIVLWFSHGHWTEETGPGLRTGEKYNESKHKAMRDAKEIAVNEDTGTIFVLAPFFENHLRDNALKSSLVVLGACKSIRDTSLADAFLSKGADCVVGSKEDFVISKLFNNAADFIDALTTQKDDGSYTTVREALNKVNSNPVNILQVGSGKFEAVFGDWWHLYNTVSGNVTITGTVIDGNTKKPIAGATVNCESRIIKTDANGEFSISGLSEYALHTVIANYSEYEENSVTINPNETWNATISLYPAGAIDLYVDVPFPISASAELYETDGSKDAEAIITEKNPIRKGSGSNIEHWLMTGLYNRQEYLISVSAVDCDTINVFVKAALEPEETHIALEKRPGQSPTMVTATVTDSRTGKPVSGASVACLYASSVKLGEGITDDNGECTVTLIRNDVSSITLKVEKDGYESLTDTASISQHTTTGVSLNLKPLPAPDPDLPDPWANYRKIYTAEDLKAADDEGYDGPAVLMNDISMNGIGLFRWTGFLEGNGHTISNITAHSQVGPGPGINDQTGCWLASNEGTIRNIIFRNVDLSSANTYNALIQCNYGTIENCRIDSGSVSSTESDGGWSCATALVVGNMKDGIIRNCVNCVDVSSVNTSPPSQRSTTSVSHGSGMVLWNAGTVEHCLNLGSVYVYSKSWYAYGCSIVCYAGWYGSTRCDVEAKDCANLGTVTVSSGHTNDGLNNYSWGDSPTMSGLGKYDSMSRNEVLACWADVLNMCPGSVPD